MSGTTLDLLNQRVWGRSPETCGLTILPGDFDVGEV